MGKYVDLFESRLAQYTGAKFAVAVVNGTSGLHAALKLAGIGQGDEVLVPALTFVATANAIAYCGAVPHFVDSEESTLGIDAHKLEHHLERISVFWEDGILNTETGRRIKAIVPMHAFGHPVAIDELKSVCERFGLVIIEDAAESLGSFYKGRHTGTFGKISVLSFNGNKIITTGGGGAILTDDEDLAASAKHLTTTAKKAHPWEYFHDMTGFNFRLPNINAALGCAQLEQIGGFLEKKRALARKYQAAFQEMEGLAIFSEAAFARSNYWLNVMLLDPILASERDRIIQYTNSRGIFTRPAWKLLHTLPMYETCPKMDLSGSELLEKRIINLPSGVKLS